MICLLFLYAYFCSVLSKLHKSEEFYHLNDLVGCKANKVDSWIINKNKKNAQYPLVTRRKR